LKDYVQNEENSNPVDYGKLSDSIISIVNLHKNMKPELMLMRLQEVRNGNVDLINRYKHLITKELVGVLNTQSAQFSNKLQAEVVDSVLKTVIGLAEKEFGFVLDCKDNAEGKIDLPKIAPERWKDRNKKIRSENVVAFVKRIYGRYFDVGFTREFLRTVDPEAYSALSTWISRNSDDRELLAEAGFDLKLRRDANSTGDNL